LLLPFSLNICRSTFISEQSSKGLSSKLVFLLAFQSFQI
jgi:hypothetical protein